MSRHLPTSWALVLLLLFTITTIPISRAACLNEGQVEAGATISDGSGVYEDDEDCSWSLSIDSDSYGFIEFTQFSLETGYDELKVDANGSGRSLLVDRNPPFTLCLPGGSTYELSFTTDGSVTDEGFEGVYNVVLSTEGLSCDQTYGASTWLGWFIPLVLTTFLICLFIAFFGAQKGSDSNERARNAPVPSYVRPAASPSLDYSTPAATLPTGNAYGYSKDEGAISYGLTADNPYSSSKDVRRLTLN